MLGRSNQHKLTRDIFVSSPRTTAEPYLPAHPTAVTAFHPTNLTYAPRKTFHSSHSFDSAIRSSKKRFQLQNQPIFCSLLQKLVKIQQKHKVVNGRGHVRNKAESITGVAKSWEDSISLKTTIAFTPFPDCFKTWSGFTSPTNFCGGTSLWPKPQASSRTVYNQLVLYLLLTKR